MESAPSPRGSKCFSEPALSPRSSMSKGTIATLDDCKKGDKCDFDEKGSKDAKGMEGEIDHTKLKSRKSVGKSLRGFLRIPSTTSEAADNQPDQSSPTGEGEREKSGFFTSSFGVRQLTAISVGALVVQALIGDA